MYTQTHTHTHTHRHTLILLLIAHPQFDDRHRTSFMPCGAYRTYMTIKFLPIGPIDTQLSFGINRGIPIWVACPVLWYPRVL